MMSVLVISLVVWLVLIFLSVTEGIEKGWLSRLTALNAPLRITPTPAYFDSYYHRVDNIAYQSGYAAKSIGEKWQAQISDPLDPEVDAGVPLHWPKPILNQDGTLKDLVKETFATIASHKTPTLIAQDYEITGALLRLVMIRPELGTPLEERQNYLTQVSYLASFADKSPYFQKLIQKPTLYEINHLCHMAELSTKEPMSDEAVATKAAQKEEFQLKLLPILSNIEISRVKPAYDNWPLPLSLFNDELQLEAVAYKHHNAISHLIVTTQNLTDSGIKGKLRFENGILLFEADKKYPLPAQTPLYLGETVEWEAHLDTASIEKAGRLREIKLHIGGFIQGQKIEGSLPWHDLEITQASVATEFAKAPIIAPPWAYYLASEKQMMLPDERSVLLPKSYQESGVQIGDGGYFSFGAMTASALQEQRLPFQVAGFYDPGVMAIGAKYILAPAALVHDIASSNHSFTFDRASANGIQVWFDDISQAETIANALREKIDFAGLSPFWKITTFYEYDFAKDLLQQFQSDRTLFTLVGVIILIVACTNIISLLVLLVNDKRREIGILQAMGASPRSIVAIFAFSGVFMGVIGSLMGTLLALVTLHNIDSVANFLSFLQGHEAFNAAFYGTSLPNTLSPSALTFILISTPLISLIAGLVPAIKASRLKPTEILRS